MDPISYKRKMQSLF